jgi:hypothetical protein
LDFAWQCCLCHQIDWITGARQSYCIPPLLIFQQIYRHPQRDGFQRAPLPSSSTDHIANIVSESQAWKNRLSSPSTHSQCFRVPAQVFGSISAPFGEPASRFTSAIERAGNWKKVREQVLEYGWMQLEETYKYV